MSETPKPEDRPNTSLEPLGSVDSRVEATRPQPIEIMPSSTILARAEALKVLLESPELDSVRSEEQRRWLLHYFTDARRSGYRADELAGYKANSNNTNRLREVIERIELSLRDVDLARPREVIAGLTEIARNPNSADRDRLKAWEVLAKIHGMLSEKLTLDATMVWKKELSVSLSSVVNLPQSANSASGKDKSEKSVDKANIVDAEVLKSSARFRS
jgi:hypothetical protein